MAEVVVGVDGGGTSTDVVVVTLEGTAVGRARGPAANWETIGLDGMAAALRTAVDAALAAAGASPDDVRATAWCLAGCDWASDVDRITPHLDAIGWSGTRLVVNDAWAALAAGAPEGWGVVSIAGTGGSTAGRTAAGRAFRTCAASIGEGSGASGLARDALAAVVRAHHGLEPTTLTAALLAATGIDDVATLVERVVRGPRPAVGPALAPLVVAASRDGDPVAHRIVVDHATRHADDVIGVARRLAIADAPTPVVRAGGVHTAGDRAWDDTFTERVRAAVPAAEVRVLTVAPAIGAAVLALELARGGSAATASARIRREAAPVAPPS